MTVGMKRRATSLRLLSPLMVFGLLLAACGDEANDREAFVRAMERQAEMSPEGAECMAVEVFDNGGLSEPEINNGADDPFNGGDAFLVVFEAALDTCN